MSILGANKLINRLIDYPDDFVIKQQTKKGTVYHLQSNLKPLNPLMVLRLIEIGRLLPREGSEQSWTLSDEARNPKYADIWGRAI